MSRLGASRRAGLASLAGLARWARSQESRPFGRDLYLQLNKESGAARRRFLRASASERVPPRGAAERSRERSESYGLR